VKGHVRDFHGKYYLMMMKYVKGTKLKRNTGRGSSRALGGKQLAYKVYPVAMCVMKPVNSDHGVLAFRMDLFSKPAKFQTGETAKMLRRLALYLDTFSTTVRRSRGAPQLEPTSAPVFESSTPGPQSAGLHNGLRRSEAYNRPPLCSFRSFSSTPP
jgi:hypothetical protein